MKLAIPGFLAVCLFVHQINVAEAITFDTKDFSIYGKISGGFLSDQALIKTAGREVQVWKMTEVLVGLEFAPNYQNWSGKIEWLPLSDDLCYEDANSGCGDYYKNLGTSILYYGDHNLREASATYKTSWWSLKTGRMENLYGIPLADAPYKNRHDAPHAYYLDKELVNGVLVSGHYGRLHGSVGVFGGRGDPGMSYNYYLNGDVDPNTKGNNTPLIESKISYVREKTNNSQTYYAGYHNTKTGSAVGTLYNGKHNDERFNIGVDLTYSPDQFGIREFRLLSQYNQYTMGLTTDGVQGKVTAAESQDLTTKGFFVTLGVEFKNRVSLQYTYEELDRMTTRVWDKIANFDPNHSSFDSVEINKIMSASYQMNENVNLSAFYRNPKFDFQEISDIPEGHSTDKFGAMVTMSF